jgi:plasmid stabilization system protein ParE
LIRLSPEAKADLRDIVSSASRPISADRRAGRITGTRELVIPGLPYIVVYEAAPGGVLVFRVIHGAMQRPLTREDAP